MGVNSELAALNSVGNMSLGNLPDRGCEAGCEGDTHGADYSGEAVNRMGSIDAGSDHHSARCFGIDEKLSESAGHPDFSGHMGSLDADSDPVTAKNTNQ